MGDGGYFLRRDGEKLRFWTYTLVEGAKPSEIQNASVAEWGVFAAGFRGY
jgi:hypothetical protein